MAATPPRTLRSLDTTRALRFAAVLLAALGVFSVEEAAAQTSTVNNVIVQSNHRPESGDTYGLGEEIRIELTFSGGAILVSSDVKLSVQIGSTTRQFDCLRPTCGHATLGSSFWVFGYIIQAGDADTDGITVSGLTGGTTTRSGGGSVSRTLAGNQVDSANYKVDGTSGLGVTGVALNSPPVGNTFNRDDVIEATVTFNQAVDVTGTPQLRLGIGSNTRSADYASGDGTASLLFRYTVVQADADTDGISIGAGALSGGTIRLSGGTRNAQRSLAHFTISNSTNHRVNGATLTAAAVNGASFTSSPAGGGDTYAAGENIEVEVTFTRAVDVVTTGGTPQLALSFDPPGLTGYTRQADYASGTGSTSLLFRYTAAVGDWDPDGLSVGASALTLNSGAINDARSASTAATLGLGTNAISDDTNHKVDGGPVVSGFGVEGPPGASDTYAGGELITATVTFNRAVTVTGAPQLALTIGTQTRQAAYYAAGSSSTALVFRYTVVSADEDTDGISIADGALDLNSGTINAADSGVAAGLALGTRAISNDANRKVDGSLVRTLVTGVALSSPDEGDTFEALETIEATVTFSRTVTVTGTPQLALTIGTNTRQADFARGSGSTSLVFSYQVQAAQDTDTDGISIGASALTLNSGTIVASGTTSAATLGLGTHAISNSTNHKVDGAAFTTAGVNGASITSSPAVGDTYGAGEEIEVEVTFTRAVDVDTTGGTPQLALSFDPTGLTAQTRQAAYASGSGSKSLLFRYTAAAGDWDPDGLSVAASALTLNSGAINDARNSTTTATLGLGTNTISDDTNHKVDGGPVVTGFSLNAPGGGSDTYTAGELITATATFNRAVAVTGAPQLALTIGTQTRQASYQAAGSSSTALEFRYTVVSADTDADGISIAGGALTLSGGTINAADSGAAAGLALGALAISNDAARKVDGSQVRAVVTDVALSSPPVGDTYERGDVIEATVTFSQAVAVTGTPQLALTIGSQTRQANFATGSGSTALVFRYTVVQADADTDGISIGATALALNSGTIVLSGGTTNALLGLGSSAISNSTDHKVNGATQVAAAVNGASITSSPASGDTYGAGEVIEATVTFSRAVDVTGTPQLALSFDPPGLGAQTGQANFVTGSGSTSLVFRYVVVAGDWDADGLSVGASALTLNSGAINDGRSSTLAATLGLGTNAIANDGNHKVDGGPVVTGLSVNPPVSGDTYEVGERIGILVTFSRAVAVTGTPQLALTIGTATRQADYYNDPSDMSTGSGTRWQSFHYTVVSTDMDADGLSIAEGALALNGGTIRTADSGTDASLVLGARTVSNLSSRKVDGSQLTAAAPDRMQLESTPAASGTYGLGERIEVSVRFDRAVAVTGTPQLALTIGTVTRQADYATGSGTNELRFRYIVQGAGSGGGGSDGVDADTDGLSIGASALALNGGEINDARSATTPAGLSLTSYFFNNVTGHAVDGSTLAAPAVSGVAVESTPPAGGYGAGDEIRVRVTFDRTVQVTGTPSLALVIGSARRQAAYVSGAGTTDLVFRYTVQTGDADPDGISVPADALALNGGTILLSGAIASGTTRPAAALGLGSHALSDVGGQTVETVPPPPPPPPPRLLSIDSPRVIEGAPGATATLRYTVTLSRTHSQPVTVAYEDAGTGSATAGGEGDEGADYTAIVPGRLTFAPRTTRQTIDVAVIGDAAVEADETVAIRLHGPVNATLASGAAVGTGTIVDDDDAALRVVTSGAGTTTRTVNGHTVTVVEGAGVPAGVVVVLSPLLDRDTVLRIAPPGADVPLESARYGLGETADRRTVVDVTAQPVPVGGVELCLPVRAGLRMEAGSRGLRLLHYGAEGWMSVSGSRDDAAGGLVCAAGVTALSPFAAGYGDLKPTFGDAAVEAQHYVQNMAIKPLTLPAASGGDGPLTYTLAGPGADGALPEGLVHTPPADAGAGPATSGGTLTGTPVVAAEEAAWTLTATDADGDSATLTFTVEVAADLMPTFGDAQVPAQRYLEGTAIAPLTLPAASGGDGALTYALTGPGPEGALPEGLVYTPPADAATNGGATTGGALTGTPALAVEEATWTLTATDADGDAATLAFTVEVANVAPSFGDARVPAQRYVQHEAIAPLALPAASGGNGPLTYALSPVLPEGLVYTPPGDAAAGGGALSGTPAAVHGLTRYTLTVRDADGDTAGLVFTIEVADLRARLKGLNEAILADLSRAMTASTVDAVAGRIGQALAPVGGGSGPMGSADTLSAFAGMLRSSEGAIEDGTWSWKRGLDGRTFAITLSGSGGDDAGGGGDSGGGGSATGGGARMTFWGAGDYRNLDSAEGGGVDWDGHLFGGHLGVDARFGAGGLAGLAVSMTEGRIDYTDTSAYASGGTVEGKYESRMTSAHPYLGWAWGTGTHAWASMGYGRGDITIIDGEAGRQKGDSRLRSAVAGGSVRVLSGEESGGFGPLTVDVKGEAWATWLEVEDNGERIAGLGVETNRVRVSAEGSRAYALEGGGVFTPSMELGMRLDGGDGETGAGVEVGGGVDYAHPAWGLSAELAGRVLVAHAGGADDWSVGGAVRMEAPSGLGLSLRVAPSYGEAGGGLSRLWDEGVVGSGAGTTGGATGDASASTGQSPVARLDAEMGYGVVAFSGTLTPYGGLVLSEGGAHGYRLGTRYLLGPAMEMSLEGEARESRTERTEHSLMLRGRMHW